MDSIVKRFKTRLKTEINYLFFRVYRYKRVVRRHFSKYYDDNHPQATNSRKMVVYMADGKYRHGGLADRLRGIVTLYRYCIEHNLDFIKIADHIIDLGPEGGIGGGQVIAQGTPLEVSKCKNSFTGQYLKPILTNGIK